MKEPLISVIIPTYKRKTYVVKAIDSVLSQTYKNIEIIVVDDCSQDGTFEVIYNLGEKNKKIVALKNNINLGAAGTANRGISFAKGQYIAMLDDDDTWCDIMKLEKQVAFLEKNKEYVLVGGGVIRIDNNDNEIARYLPFEHNDEIRKAILIDNVFAHSTVLFRKEGWEKVGGYQQDLKYFADWDLWLKLGSCGKFYNFQEFFDFYLDQQHNKIYSTHDYGIRRRLLANIALRRKYKDQYPGYKKSILLCFAGYFYSFLPFKAQLRPLLDVLRNFIFGPPPYKYY